MDDEGRDILRRGDSFVRAGDIASAVREYLAYCEHVQRAGITSQAFQRAAVHRQVLTMMPDRRDVRRSLVEDLVQLGLIEDARKELRRLAVEWEAAGDAAAQHEVVARLRALG